LLRSVGAGRRAEFERRNNASRRPSFKPGRTAPTPDVYGQTSSGDVAPPLDLKRVALGLVELAPASRKSRSILDVREASASTGVPVSIDRHTAWNRPVTCPSALASRAR
jgi:hypothetical protein